MLRDSGGWRERPVISLFWGVVYISGVETGYRHEFGEAACMDISRSSEIGSGKIIRIRSSFMYTCSIVFFVFLPLV